jgi:hypothetical protein
MCGAQAVMSALLIAAMGIQYFMVRFLRLAFDHDIWIIGATACARWRFPHDRTEPQIFGEARCRLIAGLGVFITSPSSFPRDSEI